MVLWFCKLLKLVFNTTIILIKLVVMLVVNILN
jgi:hypothetical protein